LAKDEVYYAKVEPNKSYVIKSEVNGRVEFVNKRYESKISDEKTLVQIDDYQDKINLENTKKKLKLTNSMLNSTLRSLKNYKEIVELKRKNFTKINSLRSKSGFEKDLEKINLLSIENSYYSLIEKKDQLLSQISDIKSQIKILQDNIKKKNIRVKKGLYIYQIAIEKDDFITVGRIIVSVYDISKAKLTIFLPLEELKDIESKTIFINNKKTNYKIDKIWSLADSKNISSYRVEILIDSPKIFSKLAKVSFR